MKLPLSWAAAYETPLFVLLAMITILVIGASEALAYEDYSGCESCHGGFLDDYTSPSMEPSGALASMTSIETTC